MKPKFKNNLAWEQAQILMQPAFIRVLDNLRKKLEKSVWKGAYEEIQEPYPGYILTLTNQDKSVQVDIWELCYQVCFSDYQPAKVHFLSVDNEDTYEVEIDTRLIDETGQVDWHLLETKAKHLVSQVFASLPKIRG